MPMQPDMFTPRPKVGEGNALLLADIAARLPLETISANRKAGKYGTMWKGAAQWLKFAGYHINERGKA